MQHFNAEGIPHRKGSHIRLPKRGFLPFKGVFVNPSIQRVKEIVVKTVFLVLILHKVGNVDVLFIYAQVIFDLLKLAGKLKRERPD